MAKISIKDVAKEAGVSLTTVSQILNKKSDRFSEKTVNKVVEAKKRLGYFPNKNAQQLRGNNIKSVGVLLPNLTNPFFSTMMQTMDSYKSDNVDLFFLTAKENEIEKGIIHLVERGVDGLVIAQMINNPSILNNYLNEHNIPYIVLDQSDDYGFTDIVRTDEKRGGKLAAEHLIEYGHTKLLIAQPYMLTSNMQARVDGFKQHCENYNLASPLVIETDLSKEGGFSIVDQIIESQVSAIFAMNDEMAIGIIRGLVNKGLNIPDDISIIGFDDIDIAKYLNPSLTTVAQPIEKISKASLSLITNKLQDSNEDGIHNINLANELIIRETTKKLNKYIKRSKK
ncbi:ribose utilization transcriptional repressor RbsR [Staphylococcus cohnii]|uniref:ribose utilization transcriptional repressor RbsR n=1 Tax=Staphylococcus TaxID=1279 RepID=UPI000E697A04|nr:MULTISPECIES: LacI family DNA-binding transcriptional regulator [Staphylococcus]RIO43801.1 LacI family transcriptional regulator [Staphylococcus nepalensis]